MSARIASFVAACVLTAAVGAPRAQAPVSVGRAADPAAAAPSRWAADVARVDAELQMRSLVADDPRGRWVAGRLDATDPVAQVRNYAAARAAAPREPLYLASLAFACQQAVQPSLAECDVVDRLADWATRDADNGVPQLILAGKAVRRGNNDDAVGYLQQAAAKPRMDDYGTRGALVIWEYVMALPIDVDRAAKAEAAAAYAEAPQGAALGLAVACGGNALPASRRAACAEAGAALAERGATFAARAAGATIAERTATDGAMTERVRARRAANDAERARCAAKDLDAQQGAEAADAATRARAVAAWDAQMRAKAQKGEAAACGGA